MKIRLLQNVPVAKIHGLTEGRVFETVPTDSIRGVEWAIVSDAAEVVGIHRHEAEVVEFDDVPPVEKTLNFSLALPDAAHACVTGEKVTYRFVHNAKYRIRLLIDVPNVEVEDGLRKGREMTAEWNSEEPCWLVMGDLEDELVVYPHEAEVIEDANDG